MHQNKVDDLFAFMKERYAIYQSRKKGDPKPWTKDPILQKYKFCNVYREDDRVTRWIAKNWRTPNKDNPDLWFAMCVARYVNLPYTLEMLGFPIPWKPEHFKQTLTDIKEQGHQVFTGAYIVHSLGPKIPYLANKVFTPMWVNRDIIRPKKSDTLERFFTRLRWYQGMGSFMAGQVVADMKYVKPLSKAKDWWTWAAVGPGSARGLNRVYGFPKERKIKQDEWLHAIQHLRGELEPRLADADMPEMHAQDMQSCLCEYDKMCRVRNGEGRPRSLYPGV
jgi:5-hmdU DNA kinase-like protein